MVVVVFLYVEVDRTVALIGISVAQYLFYQLLLLDDMSGGMRLYRRRQDVERPHGVVIAVGVILCNLHGLELFELSLFLYFVISLVSIMLQVAHISDIPHITHLVTQVTEVSEEHIKGDGGARMAQVAVSVNGWSADIHAHSSLRQRAEKLLLTA